MDKNTAKLVADLARHLCIELDLYYEDIQLAKYNSEAVDAVCKAVELLTKVGAEVPGVLVHVVVRADNGERQRAVWDIDPKTRRDRKTDEPTD